MPQESGADDATDVRPEPGPPRRPGRPPPGRPPRPAMSDLTPAPVPRPVPPTATVQVVRGLWIVSFALGLVVAVFALVSREAQLDRVVELVTELQPERATATIQSVATIVFWGTLAALGVMVLIEALLVRAILQRRARARWVLAVVVAAHIVVGVVADAFALAATDGGTYFRLVLAGQLVLAVVGTAAAFLPGAAAWFRAGRERARV